MKQAGKQIEKDQWTKNQQTTKVQIDHVASKEEDVALVGGSK